MKTKIIGGYTAKVGQNAQENWILLEESLPHHLFFHLTSFSSCYVIYAPPEEEKIAESTKTELAQLCLANTKHKRAKNIKVDCTLCKNVTKGDVIGEVIYTSKRKVQVIKI
jgi:predicted ribosome quality control (RQC) complex YloA/Tae2 family protein